LDSFWFCIKSAFIFLIIVDIVGFIFAPEIISLFRKEDLEVIKIGTKALRFQCISFPLSAWIIITTMLLQTIGKSAKASILSLSRQGMFFIPAIIIMPKIIGLTGVQCSQAIADVLTFIMAVPLGLSVIKELKDNMNKSLTR